LAIREGIKKKKEQNNNINLDNINQLQAQRDSSQIGLAGHAILPERGQQRNSRTNRVRPRQNDNYFVGVQRMNTIITACNSDG